MSASGSSRPPRVVVTLVGDPDHGQLAPSGFVERPFLPGGEHNMYELAFAAAALGYSVELRGWLHRPTFDRMASATGTRPDVDLEARPPRADELVVIPEGWRDPLAYLRLLLSPARLAIYVLAPPGLFGWPFAAEWEPPDPLTVALDAVARPEHFRAMSQLGALLITHSPGLQRATEDAGVPCVLLGVGRPDLPEHPPPRERPVDAVGLLSNRWAALVRQAAAELGDLTLDLIEEVGNQQVIERMARARVLLWPSRIEGHATIPWEARSVGCVPVALSTNRFAVGLDEASGAVLVDTVRELSRAVRDLLAEPARWEELSERAVRTATEEVDWDAYLARVDGFLSSLPPLQAAHHAASGLGSALATWQSARERAAQERLEELVAEEERVRADRDRLAERDGELQADRDRLAGQLGATQLELTQTREELQALRQRRSVRVALAASSVLNRHLGNVRRPRDGAGGSRGS